LSQTVTFKCPSCGGYLEFDPEGQRFLCPYCGASYHEDELRRLSREKEQEAHKAAAGEQGHLRTYHCQSCGAEIVTDDTTAATRCYYCHNPIVLTDRLSEEFRPDGVIPFQLDQKAAEAKFNEFVRKKTFIDRRFFSKDQLENFSGVYYPYWFADFEGDAAFNGEGTRVSVHSTKKETITTTRVFSVHREGKVAVRNIQRKALKKNDRKLTDGIHPYNLKAVQPYAMGYLSGFLAEKRDVSAQEVDGDMAQEANRYAHSLMSVSGKFDNVSGKTSFSANKKSLRYYLLPTWVLTYRGTEDKPYYFLMNGQTGTVCGRLPVNRGKLMLYSAIVGGIVAGLLCLGGAFLW